MWPSKGKKPKPPDLDSIRADAEAEHINTGEDTNAQAEVADFAREKESQTHSYIMHRLLELAAFSENEQRAKFGKIVFWLTVSWLFVVLGVLILDGFKYYGFSESDDVMMVLLGTTTANIIGLLIIVLKYFYRSSALEVYFKSISETH